MNAQLKTNHQMCTLPFTVDFYQLLRQLSIFLAALTILLNYKSYLKNLSTTLIQCIIST